jgi:WD40 repeat protein
MVLQPNYRLIVWKLDGPRPVIWLDEPDSYMIDFRPDGRDAVVAHLGGGLSHFDLATGRRLRRLGPGRGVRRTVWAFLHPTRPLVATHPYASPVDVLLRDLRTGAVVASWEVPHGTAAQGAAWHPDGRTFAVVPLDGKARLLDLDTWRPRREFDCTQAVLAFNHAGDRLLHNATGGNPYHLVDAVTDRPLFSTVPVRGLRLRVSRDDARLGGSVDGTRLTVWRVADGRECRTLACRAGGGQPSYWRAAVHPDGRLLAVTLDEGVGLWDLATGAELAVLPSARLHARAVLFDRDGACLFGGPEGVRRWPVRPDPADPGRLRVGPPERLSPVAGAGLAQSTDGRVLAVGADLFGAAAPYAGVWLYRPGRDGPLRLEAGQNVNHVAVSPDGRWVVAAVWPSPVRVWDAVTGRPAREMGGDGFCFSAFSPDGRWLITARDGGRLWRVGDRIEDWAEEPRVGVPRLGSYAFAPDGRLLAVADVDGVIRLVVPETGREVGRLEDPDGRTGIPCFSPDSARLVVVHRTAGVRVWDLHRLRTQLRDLDLDWDWPLPPAPRNDAGALRVDLAPERNE